MHAAVMRSAERADVVIMAAAVADYTPAHPSVHKIAKGGERLALDLERTRDILADLGRLPPRRGSGRPILVGFAAETANVLEHAREKRTRKGADLIVANDVSRSDAGFEVTTNAVTVIGPDGEREVPLQSKERVAAIVLDSVEQIIREREPVPTRA